MADEKNITFGEFVRKKRLEKDISLRQFAFLLGLSPTFISKMEVGDFDPPKEENIIKMANILEVNKDMLLGLANKVAMDVQNKIQVRPELFASFLRKVNPDKLHANWDKLFEVLDEEEDD